MSTLGAWAGTVGAASMAIEHGLMPAFVDSTWVRLADRRPQIDDRRGHRSTRDRRQG